MYLHIGGKSTLLTKDIIAIVNQESLRTSRVLRNFIRRMESENKLFGDLETAVSYLFVCDENGEEKLYCSPISSTTLVKRSGK